MNKSLLLLLTVGLLAHNLVLREYVLRMSSAGHYQFFWLAFVAVGSLFYLRLPLVRQHATKPASRVVNGLLGVCLLTAVFATLINSSFTGWMSCVLLVVTTLYAWAGRGGLRQGVGVIVALLLLTPLPGQLDKGLILGMQYLASQFASWILDAFGVFHFRQGVVLVSETNGFLAEEACSGVRSLFSGIFAIIFWGLLHRYPWWRHAVNFFQVIGWVLFGNALRIATVVWVEDKTPYSVASGLPHEILGLLTFLLIVGLALSFDRLLFDLILRRHDSGDSLEMDTAIEGKIKRPIVVQPSRVHAGWIVAFAVVALLAVRLNFVTEGTPIAESFESLPSPEQTDLPAEVEGWQVRDFEHIVRGSESLQGENSFVWSLAKGSEIAAASLDGDWADFHDLSYCYTGLGWQVETIQDYDSLFEGATDQAENSQNYSVLQLSKPTGEQGLVVFCGIDRNGKIVQPQIKLGQNTAIHLKEKSINSLRIALGMAPLDSIRKTTFSGPVTTLQIFYTPGGPITQPATDQIRGLFFKTRDLIKQSRRFSPE